MTDTEDLGALFDARLSAVCSPDVVEKAEGAWPEAFWEPLQRDGFTSIGLAEASGGSGGDVFDACAILRAVGRHAAPGPWAETGLLAGLLMRYQPGLLPSGLTTVAPHLVTGAVHGPDAVTFEGEVRHVPWARAAEHVMLVVAVGDRAGLAVLDRSSVEVVLADNVAGEPRDTVRFAARAPHPVAWLDAPQATAFRAWGALTRAALIAGALARVAELTAAYAQQRHQFGRPIAAFQLVQRHLVVLAEQAALVTGAVDAAAAAAHGGQGVPEMAAAKIIADLAAAEAAKAAHQAHGAIGMTREYRLHQFTRRLWSWRTEYGTGSEWGTWLGEHLVGVGPDALYPAITHLSGALS
jgi:acyl-CoA dehydrogenase